MVEQKRNWSEWRNVWGGVPSTARTKESKPLLLWSCRGTCDGSDGYPPSNSTVKHLHPNVHGWTWRSSIHVFEMWFSRMEEICVYLNIVICEVAIFSEGLVKALTYSAGSRDFIPLTTIAGTLKAHATWSYSNDAKIQGTTISDERESRVNVSELSW